ncbi:MAG: Excinuclease ABC C subunit domain protein [Candidatus Moranbacteria bacterium GW2011_GWF2_34_56]|nr:MAG: Excinuclease ABC C subunit domain protein [Candidatus Moranbacteria bacterium GW2011_GWF1_34_10]KKP64018.1 MAG: Excinuclease ABC C subunit domain protein [Candidatus Moranbacteria bacterium GW2011_GWF2_34_56]
MTNHINFDNINNVHDRIFCPKQKNIGIIKYLKKFVKISPGWRNWYPPATQAKQVVLLALRAGTRTTMFYTYVLKSKKDNDLYIGFTEDLKKRFDEHNCGLVKSTSSRTPLELVYYEACLSEKLAIAREKYFKTGFGRRFLKNRI